MMTNRRTDLYSRKRTFYAVLTLYTMCGQVVCQVQDRISFISEPRNMTVHEGESVRFECDYSGSDLTPSWIINNSVYYHTDIPHPYLFNDQDFSLSLDMVSLALNNTSFSCIIGRTESAEGLLFIISAYSNRSLQVSVIASVGQQPPAEEIDSIKDNHIQGLVVASSYALTATTTVTVTDYHEGYEIKSPIPLLVSSAIIALAFTVCLFLLMLVVTVRSCVLHKKQGKDNNIAITEMNDAYGVLDNRIRLEMNPVYEDLCLHRPR